MNIIEFKEKVYQRIMTQYTQDVRVKKFTWKDYLILPLMFGSIFLFSTLIIYYHTFSSKYFLPIFTMFSFGVVFILFLYFLMKFKHLINFKKQSDIFWGTSLLSIPALDDSEMKKFFLRDDIWHCKHAYTPEELDSLVAFTPKEIEEMSFISFNKNQKDLILNGVKRGVKIDFYSLGELLEISDENIAYQKLLVQQKEKKNIDDNQTILKAIKCDLVHEQIMPVNQKVKYLL